MLKDQPRSLIPFENGWPDLRLHSIQGSRVFAAHQCFTARSSPLLVEFSARCPKSGLGCLPISSSNRGNPVAMTKLARSTLP